MKTIIVKLEDAITVAGKETAELTIRKPTVKDLKLSNAAGKTELDRSLVLIGDLAGLTPTDLEALSLTDLAKINEEMAAANFIPSAPTQPSN